MGLAAARRAAGGGSCTRVDHQRASGDGEVGGAAVQEQFGRGFCGVGPVTSLTLTLLWSSPSRFKNGRAAAAYVGLAPRRDQSGSSDKQLPISKTGNATARRLLVQCALVLLGRRGVDCDLQRWARKKLEQGGKNAKKRIVVALARKLAVLLFRLWKTGDAWEPLRNVNLLLSASQGAVSCAERPKSAVSSDSAGNAENVVPHGTRAADWSTPDGSDPTMHQAEPIEPTTSADRSLGHGTTAKKPKEKQVKQQPAPQRPTPGVPSRAEAAAAQSKRRNSVAPKPPRADGKGETLKTAAFEGVTMETANALNEPLPKREAKREARSPISP